MRSQNHVAAFARLQLRLDAATDGIMRALENRINITAEAEPVFR
jgi:hypothetical protein